MRAPACQEFLLELERAFAGGGAELPDLSEHVHLRDCAPCRGELARERALDRLLDSAAPVALPARLSARVLAALQDSRATPPERALDGLLERLPEPVVPAALAQRILRRVAPARTGRWSRRTVAVAVAAGLFLCLALWWARLERGSTPHTNEDAGNVFHDVLPPAGRGDEEELLEYAVERWEILHDDDLDLTLASLDPLDELLVELMDGESLQDDSAAAPDLPESR